MLMTDKEETKQSKRYHRQLQSTSCITDNSRHDGDILAKENVRNDAASSPTTSDVGVSNDAYSFTNSLHAVDNLTLKRGGVITTGNNSINDNNGDNLCSSFFKDKIQIDRPRRKLVSKSWASPDKHQELPLTRHGSVSYTLCPSSDTSDPDAHSRSWKSSNYNRHELSPIKINDFKNKPFQRRSLRTFNNNERGYNERPLSADSSTVPVNTPLSPVLPFNHEFPLSSRGNYYYYSPSASSVQSASDEKREFSPLSSNTSANEDFSGVENSFEGASTISPGSSSSWGSHRSQDSESQNLDSLENISQTSTDPLIFNQQLTQPPLIKDSVIGYANQNRKSYPCSVFEQPTRLSFEVEVLPPKKISRSQSAGTFSRPMSQNNNTELLECKPRSNNNSNNITTEVSDDNVSKRGNYSTESCTSNGVFLLTEASTQPPMAASRISSDVCQRNRTSQTNQQQNNIRGSSENYDQSRKNYFTSDLKLKDNRVKSTLRTHAMSGHQNQLSTNFIDEFTLDALSKEDVLILWKKSEIELENKLQEVLARNRRLGLAIDYLTRHDRSDESAEV